jgi:ABC-2 type transport system permease protein
MIAFLPAFMLSNFVFPLSSLPQFLQWISYLFPARYMVSIVRSVMLKGAGMEVLWPQVLILALYATVSISIASFMYARRA